MYSHWAHFDRPLAPSDDMARELITPTRNEYSGPLEVGKDLMVIEVGETVKVHRRED